MHLAPEHSTLRFESLRTFHRERCLVMLGIGVKLFVVRKLELDDPRLADTEFRRRLQSHLDRKLRKSKKGKGTLRHASSH